MPEIVVHEMPSMNKASLVLAFAGWPDACAAATGAVQYLIETLPARKFAEIEPENFFDFTIVRPTTRLLTTGFREVKWPANEFYHWRSESGEHQLVLFQGIEPNLRWKTFTGLIASLAVDCGVGQMVTLGALLDSVPHTRETKLTGSGNTAELRAKLEGMGLQFSGYQGPTGIHSALYEACMQRSIPLASIWGHAPHYIQGIPNPKVSYAILRQLRQFLGFGPDLSSLAAAAASFDEHMERALAEQAELRAYVARLEEQFGTSETREIPNPQDLVTELEEFLKREREQKDEEE